MQGFRQEPGRQFKETFVNVARLETLRLLAALAVLTGKPIHSFDIKQAYLIADWPQEFPIWISGPTHDPTKKGYGRRLLKSLYGNKSAGRYWARHFENVMRKFGFDPYSKEGSLFVYHNNGEYVICSLYVDDGCYISSSPQIKEKFEKFLIDNLPTLPCGTSVVKLMGECTETLNLKVDQRFETGKSSIHLSQGKYLKKIMKRFGITRTSKSPANNELLEVKPDENASESFTKEFQEKIGSVIYSANGTSPGISYPTNKLCSTMHAPNDAAMSSVNRPLRFMNGDVDSGILFQHTGKPLIPDFSKSARPGTQAPDATLSGAHMAPSPMLPEDNSVKTDPAGHARGASDASWNSPRSHSGWIFTLAGGAVSWQSRMQSSTATSTSESESVSACSATRQAVYLRDTLRFCGFPQCVPTKIDIDNQAAIAWSKNKCGFNKRKHIDLSNWYIGDCVERQQVEFVKIPSKENTSDVFTKLLHSSEEWKRQIQRICTYGYTDRFQRPITTSGHV